MFKETIREYAYDVDRINNIRERQKSFDELMIEVRKMERISSAAITKLVSLLQIDEVMNSRRILKIRSLINSMCISSDAFWGQYLFISDYLSLIFVSRTTIKTDDPNDYDLLPRKKHLINVSRKFKYTRCDNITEDSINYIATILADYRPLLLQFWCRLVSNISYCHLAFGYIILDKMFNPKYESYDNKVISYYLTYGMYVLCSEELNSIFYRGERCIIDSRVASRLPISYNQLSTNPYLPTTIDPQEQNIPPRMLENPESRGLYSLVSFRCRLNILTDGLFENFEWDDVLLCGSIIQVCLFRNPLEGTFGINLSKHADEIYEISGNSSIKRQNIRDYWDSMQENLTVYYKTYYGNDLDIIVDIPEHKFDERVQRIYNHVLIHYPDAQLKIINTAKKYKYHITQIPVNIEIFMNYVGDPRDTVYKFHLPMVRNFYDGSRIMMTATSICSAFSGTYYHHNFHGNCTNPEVINKYYERGFYAVLNEHEYSAVEEKDPQRFRFARISMSNPILRRGASFLSYVEDYDSEVHGYDTNMSDGALMSPKIWVLDKYLGI